MISRETIEMNANMHKKLALLSIYRPERAVKILQDWGYARKPLKELWAYVNHVLETPESELLREESQQSNPS